MQKFKLNDWGIPNNSNKPEQITEIQENDKYYIENKGGIGGRVYNKEQLQRTVTKMETREKRVLLDYLTQRFSYTSTVYRRLLGEQSV